MAKHGIHNENHRAKPNKVPCFPVACFGFSDTKKNKPSPENIDSSRRRKSLSFFPWSRFRVKKSGTKTVPVESSNVDEKLKFVNEEIKAVKGDEEMKVKRKRGRIPAVITVVSDKSVTGKIRKAKHGSSKNTMHESRKQLDSLDSVQEEPLPVTRKPESRKASTGSKPASPENKPRSSAQRNKISHSSSIPPDNRPNQAHTTGRSRAIEKKSRQVNNKHEGKLDPIVGMSVLMVTLAIMLLCGRLCAIICTSAWLYFIPCVRPVTKSGDPSDSSDADLNSDAYKKKVILEGLLERNHRNRGML